MLFARKIMTLDPVEAWAAHQRHELVLVDVRERPGGGPGMNMKISSTIGFERQYQALLNIAEADEFIEQLTASIGPQPPSSGTTDVQ